MSIIGRSLPDVPSGGPWFIIDPKSPQKMRVRCKIDCGCCLQTHDYQFAGTMAGIFTAHARCPCGATLPFFKSYDIREMQVEPSASHAAVKMEAED